MYVVVCVCVLYVCIVCEWGVVLFVCSVYCVCAVCGMLRACCVYCVMCCVVCVCVSPTSASADATGLCHCVLLGTLISQE